MKKQVERIVLVLFALGLALSLSACLDPINGFPELNVNVTGDINFTDVTAGAFVLNNMSKTIHVSEIHVRHVSYVITMQNAYPNGGGEVVRRFQDGVAPGGQKAVFANASEDNYRFDVFWEVDGNTGLIRVNLAMPASRMVKEFFLVKSEVEDPNGDYDFEADGKKWKIIVTDWLPAVLVADQHDTIINIDNLYGGDFHLNVELKDMIQNIVNVEPVIQNIFDRSLFDGVQFQLDFGFTVDQLFDAISKANINLQIDPKFEIDLQLKMDEINFKFDADFMLHMEKTEEILTGIAGNIGIIADGIANIDQHLGLIARGFENGALILRNLTDERVNLSEVTIVPTQITLDRLDVNNKYTFGRDALFNKISTYLGSGYGINPAGEIQINETMILLPYGDYEVTWKGTSMQVSVLHSQHFAAPRDVNVVYFEKPDGKDIPKTDPIINSISYGVPMGSFYAYSDKEGVNATLPATSVALPIVLFNSNASAAERQRVVDLSASLWAAEETSAPAGTKYGSTRNILIGTGIDDSGSFWGLKPVYNKVSNTNAYIVYRLHPDANNGQGISLRINF